MIQEAKNGLDKALHHLEQEFGKLQMWRANPAIIEDVMIEQYGSMQPIKNSASIGVLDPQTLSISPWDKELIGTITKAITAANLWLNPQAGAESILIKVPQMTEETRRDMAKVVKKYWEDAKVSVRNIRWDFHKQIGKQKTEKLMLWRYNLPCVVKSFGNLEKFHIILAIKKYYLLFICYGKR